MTSSNGNIFCVTGHLCGEFTGHRWIPRATANDAEPWCLLWSALEKMNKLSWGWWFETLLCPLLSGVPDFFDRNKILSGGDLSHYQVPHCIRVFFYLFDLCLFITIFNFILNYVPIVTFWIFTYHKIWILLIIFCFIWNYWIIHFLTCLEVFWSVVS